MQKSVITKWYLLVVRYLQFHIEGLEAELTMSKNVILRKTHFKVSITAKKITNF